MAITTTTRSLKPIALALLLLLSREAFSATQQDYDACSEANDRGVAACGRIVANPDESAADRAAALVQLGNNDVTHGKLDEAIADYNPVR